MKRSKIGLFIVTSLLLNTVLIFQPIEVRQVEASYPGYNGLIIYRGDHDGPSELYTTTGEGTNNTRFTTDGFLKSQAEWSKDGSYMVFQRTDGGIGYEIYTISADGNELTKLTNNSVTDVDPSISPNGNQILFSSFRSGRQELFIMNSDGSDQQSLSSGTTNERFPKWSPDGQSIVFQKNDQPNRQIVVMDNDGQNVITISQGEFDDSYPNWSPDGSKIVFSSNRGSNEDIYIMDRDGENVVRLTTDAAIDYSPSWSPDSKHILFTSNRDGNFEVYRMNVDGSNQINLTNDPSSQDHHGRWQPIPNTSPQASKDAASVYVNSTMIINTLANDSDEEPLNSNNLTIHTQPTHGSAIIESGKIKYTPSSGYVGTDSLTYQICDSFMLDQKCSTAVLSITVKPSATITSIGDKVVENGIEKIVAQTNRPTFSGSATPGSTVKVEIHSDPIILTTTADSSGNWSVTPDQDIPPGDHTVHITATLNGVTTELDSFVLAVQQTIPNTGANSWVIRVGGTAILLTGLGLIFWQRRRMQELLRHQVPNLFP